MQTTLHTCKHCRRSFRIPYLSRKARNTVGLLASEGTLLGTEGNLRKVENFLYKLAYPRLPDNPIIELIYRQKSFLYKLRHPRPPDDLITEFIYRGTPPLEPQDIAEIVRHITSPPGVCQHCRSALDDPGVSECPNCHALNIDW